MEKTLAEIVTDNIRSAIVFEEFGLDFCCKGNRSLKEACADKNIDVKKVVNELTSLSKNSKEAQNINDWQARFPCGLYYQQSSSVCKTNDTCNFTPRR